MKKLGIIGGLGPAASCYFYETITRLTQADCDQQHLELILYSRPSIPDRSDYIVGNSGESPLPGILEAAETLNSLNVDYIAIPCVTAHYFLESIRENSAAPIIDTVEETAEFLRNRSCKSAAILATEGTIKSGIVQSALESKGIRSIVPDAESQREIMNIIKAVKTNGTVKKEEFARIADGCREKGAETVVLACTELHALKRGFAEPEYLTDCIEILAKRAIILCEGRIIGEAR